MRLALACILLVFSCQTRQQDTFHQYIAKVLQKYPSPSNEYIITSEFECAMCIGEFILKIEDRYKEKNKSIIGLIYMINKKPHNEILKLQEKTSNIVEWHYKNDLELIKSLGRITGKKAGPYHVELEGESVNIKLLSSH